MHPLSNSSARANVIEIYRISLQFVSNLNEATTNEAFLFNRLKIEACDATYCGCTWELMNSMHALDRYRLPALTHYI